MASIASNSATIIENGNKLFNCEQVPSNFDIMTLKTVHEYYDALTSSFMEKNQKKFFISQLLLWLEAFIQHHWQKSDFKFVKFDGLEEFLTMIYKNEPLEKLDLFWFGGIHEATTEFKSSSPSENLFALLSSFLIVTSSSDNFEFVKEALHHLFYHVPSPAEFINHFADYDTRLCTALLAYYKLENSTGLKLRYSSIDLFISLICQWKANPSEAILGLMEHQPSFLIYLTKMFKVFHDDVPVLKEAANKLKKDRLQRADLQEVTVREADFKPSIRLQIFADELKGSNIEEAEGDIEKAFEIFIGKRNKKDHLLLSSLIDPSESIPDIVQFFFDFEQELLANKNTERFGFINPLLNNIQKFMNHLRENLDS